MAKIILNENFDVRSANADKKGMYQFDAQDGSDLVDLVVWLEKSKANEQHPEGKPWIRLPKDNITNRAYFSEDLFISTMVDGSVDVQVKTSGPRVLGASGVKKEIIKYLSDEVAQEYTDMVNAAVEKFKNAKGTSKKKKPIEMTKEELEDYIAALRAGTAYSTKNGDGPKSFMDMFTEEEYNRYNDILAEAQENKANAPKVAHGPLSPAEKAARAAKRQVNELTKAEKLLQTLLAIQNASNEELIDESELTEEI